MNITAALLENQHLLMIHMKEPDVEIVMLVDTMVDIVIDVVQHLDQK